MTTGYYKAPPEKLNEGKLFRVRDADWSKVWGEDLSYADAFKLKQQVCGSNKSRSAMLEEMTIAPPPEVAVKLELDRANESVRANSQWFHEHLDELLATEGLAGKWIAILNLGQFMLANDDQDTVYREAIAQFGVNGGFAIHHVIPGSTDPIPMSGSFSIDPLPELPPLPPMDVTVPGATEPEDDGEWRFTIDEAVAEMIIGMGPSKPQLPDGVATAIIESIDDRYELWVNDGSRPTPTRIEADDMISVVKLDPQIVKARREAAAAVRATLASSQAPRYLDKTVTVTPPRTTPPPPDKTVQTTPPIARTKAPPAAPARPPASPLKVAMQPVEMDLPDDAILEGDLPDLTGDIGGGESAADVAHAKKVRDEEKPQ